VRAALRQIDEIFQAKRLFCGGEDLQGAGQDEDETLCVGVAEFAARLELDGVHGEGRADGGAGMDDGDRVFHAGERGADESVWREEQMIRFAGAASVTEIMHGVSSIGIRVRLRVGARTLDHILGLFRHHRPVRIRRDCD